MRAPGRQRRSRPPRFASPQRYTPKHLVEKILTSRAALEGERKLVTVLFADLKGSMELLADRDPEEARKLLDSVLERERLGRTLYPAVLARNEMAASYAELGQLDSATAMTQDAFRLAESLDHAGTILSTRLAMQCESGRAFSRRRRCHCRVTWSFSSHAWVADSAMNRHAMATRSHWTAPGTTPAAAPPHTAMALRLAPPPYGPTQSLRSNGKGDAHRRWQARHRQATVIDIVVPT